jgi:anti-sigma regulatory factor (Ser/Thr protein kinase)/nucleoid DNA-binding protein
MARITNEGILSQVAERAGVNPETAAQVFSLAVEAIQEHLLRGDEVSLENFLDLSVQKERAQIVQAEGDRYRSIIPARHGLKVEPAGRLKETIERSRIARILYATPVQDRFSEILVEHFKKVGWRVEVVTTPKRFAEKLRRSAAYLTVMDSAMKGWGNLTEELKCRAETNGIPVIAIYKRDTDPSRPHQLSVEPDASVIEPFDVLDFLKLADGELARSAEEVAIFEQQLALTFPTIAENIERCYAVFERLFRAAGFEDEDLEAVLAALREAVQNAATHGNGDDPGKMIRVQYLLDEKKATMVVRDEGEGFDARTYIESKQNTDALEALRERIGRGERGGLGLVLMMRCLDRVEYNTPGNEVILTKYRSGREPSAPAVAVEGSVA